MGAALDFRRHDGRKERVFNYRQASYSMDSAAPEGGAPCIVMSAPACKAVAHPPHPSRVSNILGLSNRAMPLQESIEERLAGRAPVAAVRRVLVDAHVHLYPVFDRGAFLAAAVRHAHAAGAELPWLLFTETSKDFAFRALADAPPEGWSVRRHADGRTLTLSGAARQDVLITAGRQVQTAEGLELLTLGLDEPIPDGTPLREALARPVDAGALPVVPWGFGKWSGRRGRLLAEFLAEPAAVRLYLGDNGGRPWFWPTPRPFDQVGAAGRRVLPGSDPLPFAGHQGRAGSYGLCLDVPIEDERPFEGLVPLLVDQNHPAVRYGRLAGTTDFVRDQCAMQIVKRTRR
jgi:hypothetical protein